MTRHFEDPPARTPTFYSGGGYSGTGPVGARCAVCGTRLDVHQAARGATCDSSECKSGHLKRLLRLEKEKQERIWQTALKQEAALVEALDLDSDECSLGVVPSNGRRLGRLPQERRSAFAERLGRKIDQALALAEQGPPSGAEANGGPREPIEDPQVLGLLATACGVCRGDCCPQGRNHAFITPETILRYVALFPGQSKEEIVANYLSYLGPASYEDSCVFHGREGCFLPREIRSDTCNEYLCKDLYRFGRKLQTTGKRQGIVVSMADERFVRVAAIDRKGSRYHSPTRDE